MIERYFPNWIKRKLNKVYEKRLEIWIETGFEKGPCLEPENLKVEKNQSLMLCSCKIR